MVSNMPPQGRIYNTLERRRGMRLALLFRIYTPIFNFTITSYDSTEYCVQINADGYGRCDNANGIY